jgi:hypothetical protein
LTRVARNSLGLKAPRGWGWITNPRRAAYNRVYNRATVGVGKRSVVLVVVFAAGAAATAWECTRGSNTLLRSGRKR